MGLHCLWSVFFLWINPLLTYHVVCHWMLLWWDIKNLELHDPWNRVCDLRRPWVKTGFESCHMGSSPNLEANGFSTKGSWVPKGKGDRGHQASCWGRDRNTSSPPHMLRNLRSRIRPKHQNEIILGIQLNKNQLIIKHRTSAKTFIRAHGTNTKQCYRNGIWVLLHAIH